MEFKEGQEKISNLIIDKYRKELLSNANSKTNPLDLTELLSSTTILSQESLNEFVRGDKPTERYIKLEKILGLTRYGESFKIYMNKAKKTNEEKVISLQDKLKEIRHDQEILKTKYNQKVMYSSEIGDKEGLIDEINDFYNDYGKEFENSSEYPLIEINVNELNKIKEIKKENEKMVSKIKDLKMSIIEQNLGHTSLPLLVNTLQSINKKLIKINQEKNNRLNSIKKAKKRKVSISKTINSKQRVIDLEKKSEKIQYQINELKESQNKLICQITEKYKTEETKDLDSFPKQYEEWMELNTNYSKAQNIKAIKDKLDQKELEVKNVTYDLNQQKDKLNNYNQKLLDINILLNKSIDKRVEKKESHVSKIINEIQNQIISSNTSSICSVCGTNFNTEENLRRAILLKVEESHQDLSLLEKKIRDIEMQKSNLIIEREKVQKVVSNLDEKILILNNNIYELNKDVQLNLSFVDPSLLKLEVKQLIEKIEKTDHKINIYQMKYNLSKEHKNNSNRIEILNAEIKYIDEEIKNVIKDSGKYGYYFKNSAEIYTVQTKLEKYINAAELSVSELEDLVEKETRNWKKENQKLEKMTSIIQTLEIYLNKSIDTSIYLNEIIVESIETKSILSSRLEGFINEIVYQLNNEEFIILEKDLKNKRGELQTIENFYAKHKKISEELIALTKNHKKVQSKLIKKYLSELTEEINNFFKQISPHAYFDSLELNIKENELFILLNDKNYSKEKEKKDSTESMNASLTFSAAQSTVLALSIFLALNISQNWSKLNVLGIDDPFQNLDDINVYSFIDVISYLVTEENKQLFISTHHQEFSKLIAAKLNLQNSQLTQVSFQSYTQETVEVVSDCYTLIDKFEGMK